MGITITFDDKAFIDTIKSLEDMDNMEVEYGIFPDAGQYQETGRPGNLHIATVLAMHELQDKPDGAFPRRDPLAKSFKKLNSWMDSQMAKGIRKHLMSNGQTPLRNTLDDVGGAGAQEARSYLGDPGSLIPNEEFTVDSKKNLDTRGSNAPLYDFGIIHDNIIHRVSKGGT